MLLYLFQGMTLGLSAAIMPGPFQAFLLSHALKNGWQRTLPASLAPLITDGPIIAIILFLLTQAPQIFLDVLRIAGGFFILYLARGIFLVFKEATPALEPDENATRKGFFYAVAINALNPNPYIFWSVVAGPIVLSGWRESASLGISFLIGFYGTFVGSVAVLIILFSMAGRINPRLNRILSAASFTALCAFGLYQIFLGVRTFI
ncbi:LysE family translocator [Thermodesulfobacteriota bacterium]